jgi:arylsulfatase A-like enzyme
MTRSFLVPALALLAGAPMMAATVEDGHVQHVLLISVDGMHPSDLANYIAANQSSTSSALVALSNSGITYTNALTGGGVCSDSFPGLCGLVTGGFPGSTGLWYDDAYDRSLYAPGAYLPGLETNLAEPLDYDNNYIDGGITHNGGTPQYGADLINPANLPLNGPTGSSPSPVYPHQIERLNTIFEVVRNAGMYTAWSDKHPAYEWVMGPSGTGLNDFYAPEINSFALPNGQPQPTLAVAGSGIGTVNSNPTAYNGSNYATVNPSGWDLTNSEASVQAYDSLKVTAILNQINGKTALGNTTTPANKVPNLFGMNFQSLSVAQKLRNDPNWNTSAQQGGYTSATGAYATGSPVASALSYVDAQLGSMVSALKTAGLYNSTLIIVTAKHGQSPIDVTTLAVENNKYDKAPNGTGKTVIDPLYVDNNNNSFIANVVGGTQVSSGIPVSFGIGDDVYLIWLQNPDQTAAAAAMLQNNAAAFSIQTVYYGAALQNRFHVIPGDPRAPDLFVQPIPGTIFNSGKKKISEHGGGAPNDINVALLVSTPGLAPATVTDTVLTTSVAPMIVKSLGLSANLLESTTTDGTVDLEFSNGSGTAPAVWTNPLVGPAGAPGATGAAGAPGAPGAAGANGANGISGVNGSNGSNGKCGAGAATAGVLLGLFAFFGLRRRRK